jgi:hypothetical protein
MPPVNGLHQIQILKIQILKKFVLTLRPIVLRYWCREDQP